MPAGTMEIRVIGSISGEMCYTNLDYQTTDDVEVTGTAQSLLELFWTQNGTLWKACCSEDYTFVRLEASLLDAPASTVSYGTLVLNEPGAVADQSLPPFVTASYVKVASPLEQTGTDTNPIKRGRLAFSGIPESFQDAGFPVPDAIVTLQNLGDALRVWGDASDLMEMKIFRYGNGAGEAATKNALVSAVQFRRIGTQNTRKS